MLPLFDVGARTQVATCGSGTVTAPSTTLIAQLSAIARSSIVKYDAGRAVVEKTVQSLSVAIASRYGHHSSHYPALVCGLSLNLRDSQRSTNKERVTISSDFRLTVTRSASALRRRCLSTCCAYVFRLCSSNAGRMRSPGRREFSRGELPFRSSPRWLKPRTCPRRCRPMS